MDNLAGNLKPFDRRDPFDNCANLLIVHSKEIK